MPEPLQHEPRGRQLFAVNFDQQNGSMVEVSCRDYQRYIAPCPHALGWDMTYEANSEFVGQIRASGRVFREQPLDTLIVFHFEAGQECFGHLVPTEDPRLMHFDQATNRSVTPIMRRNAKPWQRQDYMEKMHEESDRREDVLHREGLI